MRVIAEVSVKDLEDIYELSYKYGWIVSEERQTGWLPDRAYIEKAKIENMLFPLVDTVIDDMSSGYARWYDFHKKDGWIESMIDDGFSYDNIANFFPPYWNIGGDLVYKIYELAEKNYGTKGFFEEDPTYFFETFREMFIDYLAEGKYTEEFEKIVMDALDKGEYLTADDLVESYPELADVFETFVENNFDFIDYLNDVYGTNDLTAVVEMASLSEYSILEQAYELYLNRFPGLEEIITGVGDILDELNNSADLPLLEKLTLIQKALNFSHYHGTMADHVLDVGRGSGQAVLDRLSEGREVTVWDKELEGMLGHPLGEIPGLHAKLSKLASSLVQGLLLNRRIQPTN